MKILYKQPVQAPSGSLHRFGIQNCYLKKLSVARDRSSITKKLHHHSGFELHIIINGHQKYEVAGKFYHLDGGSFLMIYPNVPHRVLDSAANTQKFSVTFTLQTDLHSGCLLGKLTQRMFANLAFISDESLLSKEISATLIENNILETLIAIFRLSGIKESTQSPREEENATLSLAKQYIDDNIENAPSVADVSQYCHLSPRQLTRIFQRYEGISPGEYIINSRTKRIEKLLEVRTLSLKQISDRMKFNNEYYFNAFFKKHSGMPPGEYRKMLGQ